jgi:NAD(P)H-hydrate epimerase
MIPVYTAQDIRDADAFTILQQPITSIDLMEQAAKACVEWLTHQTDSDLPYILFCGPGNNGGDGLAIARLLLEKGKKVQVVLSPSENTSPDHQINLERLIEILPSSVHTWSDGFQLSNQCIIIDALLGTGINRQPDGIIAQIIQQINHCPALTIAIDIPSGLYCDESSHHDCIVKVDYTLSFEYYKKSFLFPQSGPYCGSIQILSIGLLPSFQQQRKPWAMVTETSDVTTWIPERSAFSHKGDYGKALLGCGEKGKMGACVLAAKAALRSGLGLLTALIPESEKDILQTAVPEAMLSFQTAKIIWDDVDAIGCGSGIGTSQDAIDKLEQILKHTRKPLVLDADGINLLASNKMLLKQLPARSILTPHPKEFQRLSGIDTNRELQIEEQLNWSVRHKIYIVLKGRFTSISTPDGKLFFNNTGNAGMAKGGSGDVLTGIITALLARLQDPFKAAIYGTHLHGLAGDFAQKKYGSESMLATDLIESLPQAWKQIQSNQNESFV